MTAPRGNTILVALLLAFSVTLPSAQAMADQADSLRYGEVKHASGITYVAGGVGEESQQQLQQYARDNGCNLKLVFTVDAGNYLADVSVALQDEQGRTLIKDVADGPFLVAKVPHGVYTVEVTYGGRTEARKLRIGGNGMQTAYFRWPANPQTDFIVAGRSNTESSSGSSGGSKTGSGR